MAPFAISEADTAEMAEEIECLDDTPKYPDDKSLNPWFVYSNEEVKGPLDLTALQSLLKDKSITTLSYACKQGWDTWKPLANIPELKSLVENIQPDRLPLSDIDPQYKYISPEGVGQVYDVVSRTWMSFADYQNILAAEPAETLKCPSEKTAESHRNDVVELPKFVEAILERRSKNAENRKRYRERLKEKRRQGVFLKSKTNPNIYVRGLPPDVKEEELVELFKKAGVFKLDLETSLPKIKIYRKPDGTCNGDATISYAKENSVNVALKYLNNAPLRGCECPVTVERAIFKPSKERPTQLLLDREVVHKKALAARCEERRLLGWGEGIRNKHIRVMILRPLWTYQEAQRYPCKDPFYSTIASQVKTSLSEWIHVVHVKAIDRHPYGIVCVKFRTVEDCEGAVAQLNGQSFTVLEMPDREQQIIFQNFLVWEEQRSAQALHRGTEVELGKPDDDQLELLKRLDQMLVAQETSQAKSSPPNLKQDSASQPFASNNLMTRRKYLMEYLNEKPLEIEAYVYDGKTDLAGQALPDADALHASAAAHAEPEKSNRLGSEQWEAFLQEADSDDEDLVIKTEAAPEDDQNGAHS